MLGNGGRITGHIGTPNVREQETKPDIVVFKMSETSF